MSGANRPSETASESAIAITPSTVIFDFISGHENAFKSGFGRARPEVSIMIWSGFSF